MEIINSGKQKNRRLKKGEQNLRVQWDTTKQTKTCIVIVPEGEERERNTENIWRNTCWKCPKFDEDMNTNIQEAQQILSKMNSETHTQTHCNQTFKRERKNLKRERKREWVITYKRPFNNFISRFLNWNLGGFRQWDNTFKLLKEKRKKKNNSSSKER